MNIDKMNVMASGCFVYGKIDEFVYWNMVI